MCADRFGSVAAFSNGLLPPERTNGRPCLPLWEGSVAAASPAWANASGFLGEARLLLEVLSFLLVLALPRVFWPGKAFERRPRRTIRAPLLASHYCSNGTAQKRGEIGHAVHEANMKGAR